MLGGSEILRCIDVECLLLVLVVVMINCDENLLYGM